MSNVGIARPDFRVEGVAVNLPSLNEAVSSIVAAAERDESFCVFTLNLDHCAQLRRDRAFRSAYRRAQYVTADGFPIVAIGRMAGAEVQRTTGADLVEPLCIEAARNRLPIALFGPNATTIFRARAHLSERIPDIEIVDSFAPGMNFDPYSAEADRAIERIGESGAKICFVAVGAPRQEIFSVRCLDMIPGVALICVGAALDFIAGTHTRAPAFFQNNGLEWLWRLSSNPRRFGPRYLRCAAVVPRLVADVIPQAVSTRRGRLS